MTRFAAWAAATITGWAAALAGLALTQADRGDPEPVEAWAVLVGVSAFSLLCATVGGLALRQRWAFLASAAGAAVLLVVVVASVRDDRSMAEWFVQAISLAAVGVVSGLAWQRTAS